MTHIEEKISHRMPTTMRAIRNWRHLGEESLRCMGECPLGYREAYVYGTGVHPRATCLWTPRYGGTNSARWYERRHHDSLIECGFIGYRLEST